jgi:ketosteroid isomerase-like protein
MSDAGIELIQRVYAAFRSGGTDAIMDDLTDDVSWGSVGRERDFPPFGIRQGKAGVREFFRVIAEHAEFSEFSPEEFHATGDEVFVLGHYRVMMRRTGRLVESDWLHVFTLRRGKIASCRIFTDTAQFALAWGASA